MDTLKYLQSHKAFTFILVIIAMICILILMQTSLKAFADGKQTNGSTIGGVSVSGLKEDEIKEILESAIVEWKSQPIIIKGGGAELSIDPQEIQFDIESSIANYQNLIDKPLFLFWTSDKVVHLPLYISDSEVIKNRLSNISIWDIEATYNQVIMQASYLKSHEVEATVIDTTLLENERIALSIEQIPTEARGVLALAESLNDYILKPNEPFSLLTYFESLNLTDEANLEGFNFFSSLIYNTVLQGEVDILERHSQKEIPTYLQPGMDVYVDAFSEKDLQFVNVSEHPYLLKSTVEDDQLKVALHSAVKDSTIHISVHQQSINPRIINRYSNDLPMGTTKLIQEGEQGLRVTVSRKISKNGDERIQEISRDYYPPKNRIVLISAKKPVFENSDVMEEQGNLSSFNFVENVDLNGDGLPDYDDRYEVENHNFEDRLPPGSYYDKGGNLVTP